MTRARVAFAVSGVALDLVITDLETGGLAAEIAGFTCAEAATANVTLRTKAANIEFFIFLPNCSNHRFLAGVGHLARRNYAPLGVNSEKDAISLILKAISLQNSAGMFRAAGLLSGTLFWQARGWK